MDEKARGEAVAESTKRLGEESSPKASTLVPAKQRKGRQSASFLRWLGHSSLQSSLCERSDAELGSHSPLEDRQARLSGGERANHGAKRSYPSAISGRAMFAPTKDTLHFSKNMV